MKTLIVIAALICAPELSLAWDTVPTKAQPSATATAAATSAAAATSVTSVSPNITTTTAVSPILSNASTVAPNIANTSGASAPTSVSNTVGGTNYPYQAPAVLAPGLTSGQECIGSFSAGASGPWFGLTFGSTRTHQGCERRRNAEILDRWGMREAALRLLAKDADVADALEQTGQLPMVKAEVVQHVETHAGLPLIDPKP